MISELLIAASIASSPDLGIAAGRCAPSEAGASFVVDVEGLKDRAGRIKLELYPATAHDFLADDNILVAAGKPFARVDMPTPPVGAVRLCIRAPGAGRYALMLLHDRNGDHKFELSSDGIGFSRNPHLGWGKPLIEHVAVEVGNGPRTLAIILNYRHGLGVRPERPSD